MAYRTIKKPPCGGAKPAVRLLT